MVLVSEIKGKYNIKEKQSEPVNFLKMERFLREVAEGKMRLLNIGWRERKISGICLLVNIIILFK